MTALRRHIAAVEQRFGDPAAGPAIDFKLAASSGRKSEAAAAGSKFDRLTVATCKEVVSMGQAAWLAEPDPAAPAADQCGGSTISPPLAQGVLPAGARHVEPAEFHAMLAEAAAGQAGGGAKPTVLIDTRNYYETRIGRFQAVGGAGSCTAGRAVVLQVGLAAVGGAGSTGRDTTVGGASAARPPACLASARLPGWTLILGAGHGVPLPEPGSC